MRRAKLVAVALMAFVSTTAAAKGKAVSQAAATPDKAAIQALDDQFAAKVAQGDAAGIAKLYAPDAIVLPPGAPRVDGRSAVHAYWTEGLKGISEGKLTATDVRPLGLSAVQETGSFALRTKGPTPQTLTGKYVVIWRNNGGTWQIATDAWNADK